MRFSKPQSSMAVEADAPQRLHEESKQRNFETESSSSKAATEAPPKNSDERVERLLAKLEAASHMTDIEELTRELKYLDDFDLLCHYSDDQI